METFWGMTNRPHEILAQMMKDRGLTDPSLAELAGTSKQQIFKLRRGERELDQGWAERLAPHLGTAWPSLLGWDGDPPAPVVPRELGNGEKPALGYLVLREYDIHAGAGDGTVPHLDGNGQAYMVAEWTVPRALLPAQYQSGNIAIIRVQGDSMIPEILPEERVMVDTSQTFVGPEGIYLLWESDSLLVKRVQKLPGKKLRIVSRNPEYLPYEQPVEEVRVLGRVIGRWEWK